MHLWINVVVEEFTSVSDDPIATLVVLACFYLKLCKVQHINAEDVL